MTLDYSNHKPVVHLTGTPHARGAKRAVGQLRKALRDLAAVLVGSGWADDHPIDDDEVALGVIELVSHLGTAERHALRIATSVLVRVAVRNGYHTSQQQPSPGSDDEYQRWLSGLS